MRRICCFCETWESGGIESFLTNILLHMDLSDLEVDIVAFCIKESVFTEHLTSKGIHFVQLSGKQRDFRNQGLFRALIQERRYDVIHFNLFQGLSLYYVEIAKQEGVPVRIAHSHNTALRKSSTRWLKLMLHNMGRRLFTASATDLWACSKNAAEFLFSPGELTKRHYHFIPNGIQTERFQFDKETRNSIRQELNLSDNFVIGNVGRLCYQKNQDFLLDVFAEVQKHCPESRLLLIGEGEQRKYLEEKSKQLGISGQVIFYGTSRHVERLFCAMDVFAFPSLFEGLGIVAVEAQASGLPVLCSEHIPEEAHVTPLIKTLLLTAPVSDWSCTLSESIPHGARSEGSELVRQAGFHIADVSEKIYRYYTRQE